MERYKEEVIIRCALKAIEIENLKLNEKNIEAMLERYIIYENKDFIGRVIIATHLLKNSANSITSNEIIKELPVVKELFTTNEKILEESERILKNYE